MSIAIKKSKISNTSFLIICLFPLLFLTTLNSTSTSLKPLGLLSIGLILMCSLYFFLFYYSVEKTIHISQLWGFLFAFAFLLIQMLGLLNQSNSRSIIAMFQFLTVIAFFMFSSLIKWDQYRVKIAKRLSILFILFLPIITDLVWVGAFMVFPLFFILLQKKKSIINYLAMFSCVILIYLSEARAVYILLAAAALTYMFWNFISRTKFRFTLFFLTLILGLMSFIYIYPNLIYWSHFYTVNELVFKYTGGRLMSGRNELWLILTELINQKPLLGQGTGVVPSDFIQTTLSSHNLYIQTLLQNGYLGLTTLFALFFVIWITFYKSKKEYHTRLSASFFVGILIYQSFEVVLTQNKIDLALMLWLIISVGVSNSIYTSKKEADSL